MHPQLPVIAVLTDRYIQYQADIAENIVAEINAAGYGMLCIAAKGLQSASSSNESHTVCNSVYAQINQFNVQGIIALSGTLSREVDLDAISRFLNNFDVPVVSFGMDIDNIPSVYLEECKGMHDLMNHLLIDRARKRFVYVRGHLNDPYSLNRENIFRESLQAEGYTNDDILYLEGDYNAFTTYQLVTELLNSHTRIDCIVAANDVMAASAARAVKAFGLKIPEDISISGFDDSSDATRHSPALTTVRQPIGKMAHDSVALLLQQIAQSKSTSKTASYYCKESSRVGSIGIVSELVVRRSTKFTDTEIDLGVSLDELTLRHLLNNAMYGLETPEQLTMSQISEPLWETLQYGSVDLTSLVKGLGSAIVSQHSHWWLNLCDQIDSLCEMLLECDYEKANIALVGSAISKVKERIWSLEMDQKFEASRLQNVKSDMQLAMSSCTTIKSILDAMDGWLANLNPRRCFLVRYENVGAEPDSMAQLLHIYRNGRLEKPNPNLFHSNSVLPIELMNELDSGLLVFSPVYADDIMFGYLLVDPRGMEVPYIEAAAQCIGNAMRTRHHIGVLQTQKYSLQSKNAELTHFANFDTLTGLANRLQFQQHIKACTDISTESKKPFALLFLDLDGFKLVNDTLGHSSGDQLLNQVAQRILYCVSSSTDYEGFISRLGGDEFTIILHEKHRDADIHIITQTLLESLSAPYSLADHEVSISASIGCAQYPEDATDPDNLIKNADVAMYAAKDNGKNNIAFFQAYMANADNQELQLAQDLRAALANNELCMFYQPRIDLKTGEMCAVEALMRWFTPSNDTPTVKAYPDAFIALAEKIGIISQLDTYALHYSCKQAAQWSENGTPLLVSVNVSVNQLQQDDFVFTVMNAIEKYQLNPGLLELEITETAAMTDVESNICKLTQLIDAGIHVSIDDFGTGYSSLNYLKRLPVTNLKIDRSFITDIVQGNDYDSADEAIVQSIVTLGKSMNFGVIVEGIETLHQHDFVSSLDCDQAQGYLYEKAVSAQSINDLLSGDAALQTVIVINTETDGHSQAA